MIKKHRPGLFQLTDVSDIVREGVAVVTGASAGLGRALAIELAGRGVKVAGLGRRADKLDETAALAAERFFTPITADVGDPSSVRAAFERIKDEVGNVTILVNNAAVYERMDFLQATTEKFMRSIDINLGGVVACCRAALEPMTETGIGRIINVGSFADLDPLPGSAAYSVSKGAARIFTRALVADLSDRFPNIVISTWMPGILATEMGVANGLAPEIAARWGANLALWHDPDLNGLMFEQNREMPPPRSLKGRLRDLVTLRKPPAARLLDDPRA